MNPLLQEWTTPFGLPPFADIRAEHFEPAFAHAMARQRQEIDAIAAQTAPPSFDNTIAALDRCGRLFSRIDLVFQNLCASETSAALQQVQREMAGPLAAHHNAMYLHGALFARVDALHRSSPQGLSAEQSRLLQKTHQDFVRAGARLQGAERERYAQVTERLASLTTAFGQNVLADETRYRLELPTPADLAGLPEFVVAAAQQAARERGLNRPVVTLSRSLVVPFLTFSDRRDLREAAWLAWTSRGEHDGLHDNRPLIREIMVLRCEQAKLLGYNNYADYALNNTMAKNQAAVMRLLDDVWQRAVPAAQKERAELVAEMQAQGVNHELECWDWRYWAEKVRQKRYAIDDAEVKPYFALDRMVEAAFDCASRLFGIRFTPRADIKSYHPDVKTYEVRAQDDRLVGVFLHDNFARPSKRSGAWMSNYREQSRNTSAAGGEVVPIVVNNNNFAKAAEGQPTLLSFDDVRTLFHEFGHGLHGLLSNVQYERLSGTNVLRDFVELPSQLFEHWMSEPEVLRRHARHVHTGQTIPDALIERLQTAQRFGQGYETLRYTASALTDMALHALPAAEQPRDAVAFEAQVLAQRGLPQGVGLNHRFVHFQHLFSGYSYAAGYYVYLWAEVLDCDAFQAFVEAGDPFDAAVAKKLYQHIYSAGDSVEPQATYTAFRGRVARIEPMLRERGLLEPA